MSPGGAHDLSGAPAKSNVAASETAGGFARVVVAYDGSDRARDALALALRLREPSAGSVTLVCVRTRRRAWDRVIEGDPPHPDAVGEGVGTLLAEARHAVAPGVRVGVCEPSAASAARGLTELAAAEAADLIVVGSSRHAPEGRVATERTAGRLLHGAPCAVAIAPAGARGGGPFRHIGVAFDGSPEAGAAVTAAYALAARDRAAVSLVRALPAVAPPPDAPGGPLEREHRLERRQALNELDLVADATPEGVNPRTLLLRGAPETVIKEACNGVVDLLIAGSRGYGPLRSALLGSVSESLVEGAPHPVVVIARTPAPATGSSETARHDATSGSS